MKYKTNKYWFDFQQFKAIWSFSHLIGTVKINVDEAEIDQSSLLENIAKFNKKFKPKAKERKTKNKIVLIV